MIGDKHAGDAVLCIGHVQNVTSFDYIDNGPDNMDNMVGQVVEIVEVEDDYARPGKKVYKVAGNGWWWAPEWLSEPHSDQLLGQISIEDFGLVVDS